MNAPFRGQFLEVASKKTPASKGRCKVVEESLKGRSIFVS